MKVLVIGGTRFFGMDIVRFLLDKGYKVTVLSRKKPDDKLFDFVNFIQADRKDVKEMEKIFDRKTFDFVIDNIAYDEKDVIQIKYILGEQIGHYIMTSSCAVYIIKKYINPILEEEFMGEGDSGLEVGSPLEKYALDKRSAERILWEDYYKGGKFKFTIVRPPIVIGPRDPSGRFTFWMKRIMDGKEIILPGSGLNVTRFVFSEDLAYSYIKIIENCPFKIPVFNIASFEIVNLRTLLFKIAGFLNTESLKIVDVPFRFLKENFTEYKPPYVSPPIFVPSIERARREIGLRDSGVDRMIEETVKYFINKNILLKDDPLRKKELDFTQRFKRSLKAFNL